MRALALLLSALLTATAAKPTPVSTPRRPAPSQDEAMWGETPEQAASRARALLADPGVFGVATLSAVFPPDHDDASLAGMVSSGPEYFAPCYDNGDVLMVAMTVSQNWRNALASPGRNATLSVTSNPDPRVPDPRHASRSHPGSWRRGREPWRRGMPSKQRVTLFGHVQRLDRPGDDVHHDDDDDEGVVDEASLAECFTSHHPDASHWIPGARDSPHFAVWTRFRVERVYRVGGFGDEASIGWIELERWRRAPASSAESRASSREEEEGTIVQPPAVDVGGEVLFAENAAGDVETYAQSPESASEGWDAFVAVYRDA